MSIVAIVNGKPQPDFRRMRHVITILSQGPTSPPTYDSSGQVLSEWSALTTAKAAIETVSGTDQIRGGQTTTQLLLVITMRFQAGILPNMRVQRTNGNTFIIQSIENILEMDHVLLLNCLGLGAND